MRVPNVELTLDPPKPASYAYCSDTAYLPELVSLIRGVHVLYHEATFLEADSQLATATQHSTAKQAAMIARSAEVGKLILGHFSTRYKSTELFRQEAFEIFPEVSLADDGKIFDF
jgi:ribonuclease Z